MSTTTTSRREWKLTELAEAVGVSPRTVRYYVQRGLLPAPPFKGPDTVYGEDHLVRLKAIRVLQARFLPLDAIQVELTRRSPEALQALLEEAGPQPAGVEPAPEVPAPPPAPVPARSEPPVCASPGESRWWRWELAPGLELHLADTADEKTRALAQRVRALMHEPQER